MILKIVDGPNQPHSCFSQMTQPQAKQNATCKADWGPTKAGQGMKMHHVRSREASVMVTAERFQRLRTDNVNPKGGKGHLQLGVIRVITPDRHECDSHMIEDVQRKWITFNTPT